MIPQRLYHISSQVPDDEEFLIPHKPRIRKEFSREFLYASAKPNYTYMFRQGNNGKIDGVIDFYDFLLDDTNGIIVITSDIEKLRDTIKNKVCKIYTIDGTDFDECGENEYSSEKKAKILNKEIIGYNELLQNTQVFYADVSNLSDDDKKLLYDYRRRMLDEPERTREIIRTVLQKGLIVYENATEHINDKWIEEQEKGNQYGRTVTLDDGRKLDYDIMINADEIDYDCLKITEISEPTLKKYQSKSGKRIDVIECRDLEKNSILNNGRPSFQSIEMMIAAVNGTPNSIAGEQMLNKARQDYPLEYMKQYYYHLSQIVCIFAQEKEKYPYSLRGVMMLRMLREFYPKAEWLSSAIDYKYLQEEFKGLKSLTPDEQQMYNKLEKILETDDTIDENLLEELSKRFTDKLKGKTNVEFSNEIIRKLEELGVKKYLSNELKEKLLEEAIESEEIRLLENKYITQLVNSDDITHQMIGQKIIEIAMSEISRAQNGESFSEKTKWINKPINVDGYTVYVNTITKDGKMFPYILVYPQNIEENAEILVDTLNTVDSESTKNRIDVFVKGADEVSSYIRIKVPAPCLYVFIPKKDFLQEPYYQQLSRECFTESDREYDRCDLLVLESIKDAQKKMESLSGKKISEKIVLNGYSTSGVFAQRFAMIHPDIISKAIIGAAAGSIPIPTEDFDYPLGIRDFEKLFGKKFDEESYRKIQFAYYVGELEAEEKSNRKDGNGKNIPTHDMSYLTKSIPEDIGEQYRSMFGTNLDERFINAINWYDEHGYRIVSKVYKDGTHKNLRNKNYAYALHHLRDLFAFGKDGISGDGFKKDESSVERIKMCDKDRKSELEDSILNSELQKLSSETAISEFNDMTQNIEGVQELNKQEQTLGDTEANKEDKGWGINDD